VTKIGASRSRIDKAGRVLAAPLEDLTEEYLDLERVFDDYRESHLQPLTNLTSLVQGALSQHGAKYYIAQRLKRRPQILRKLNRLHVRLTQLQDIGGLRVIVKDNDAVDRAATLIDEAIHKSDFVEKYRDTDYRPNGRDDSGYRAFHKIVSEAGLRFEVQIRTDAQHYWAESIERTSVFYGKRLKEGEGSNDVLSYFRSLSEVFADIERGARLGVDRMSALSSHQEKAEEIIRRDGHSQLMDGAVNEDVIQTLIQKERSSPSRANNWILVFDWRSANFVTWDIVSRDPAEAVKTYSRYEKDYPETQSYEVVLIGSSDVATVQNTHSHYFGITSPDKVLEDLGQSIERIDDNASIDHGAKQILSRLAKRRVWGEAHGVQRQTLKNHFCKDVVRFDEILDLLMSKGYILNKGGAGVTLNVANKGDIEKLL